MPNLFALGQFTLARFRVFDPCTTPSCSLHLTHILSLRERLKQGKLIVFAMCGVVVISTIYIIWTPIANNTVHDQNKPKNSILQLKKRTTSTTENYSSDRNIKKILEAKNTLLQIYSKINPSQIQITPETKLNHGKFHKICALEKRFMHSASYKCDGDLYMSPNDLVLSLFPSVPGCNTKFVQQQSPERKILITVEEVAKIRGRKRGKEEVFLECQPRYSENPEILLTFPEYNFLYTIISTSLRNLEVVFRMIDVDGDGLTSLSEFYYILSHHNQETVKENVTLDSTTSRTNIKTEVKNNSFNKDMGDVGLLPSIFGVTSQSPGVNLSTFKTKVRIIRDELCMMKYEQMTGGKDKELTDREFANIILSYLPSSKLKDRLLERANSLSSNNISRKLYLSYMNFKDDINALEDALNMYTSAGLSVNRKTFQRAVKAVCGYELKPQMLEILFFLFDENGDGHLSHDEFVGVIKKARNPHGIGLKSSTNYQNMSGVKGLAKCWVDRMSEDRY